MKTHKLRICIAIDRDQAMFAIGHRHWDDDKAKYELEDQGHTLVDAHYYWVEVDVPEYVETLAHNGLKKDGEAKEDVISFVNEAES